MNKPELTSSTSDESQERINASDITVDDFLAMTPEERWDKLEPSSYFTADQIRELWERRDELDLHAFRKMLNEVDPYSHEYDEQLLSKEELEEVRKKRETCPFTGLRADTSVSAHDPMRPIGEEDILIHNSVVKDLAVLALRVGENDLHIANNGIKFILDTYNGNIEITDNIGAIDEAGMPLNSLGEILTENLLNADCMPRQIEIKTPKGNRKIVIHVVRKTPEIKLEIQEDANQVLIQVIQQARAEVNGAVDL